MHCRWKICFSSCTSKSDVVNWLYPNVEGEWLWGHITAHYTMKYSNSRYHFCMVIIIIINKCRSELCQDSFPAWFWSSSFWSLSCTWRGNFPIVDTIFALPSSSSSYAAVSYARILFLHGLGHPHPGHHHALSEVIFQYHSLHGHRHLHYQTLLCTRQGIFSCMVVLILVIIMHYTR